MGMATINDETAPKHKPRRKSNLPDRHKIAVADHAAQRKLEAKLAKADNRGEGCLYDAKVLAEVVRLRRQGLTLRAIGNRKGQPAYQTLYWWYYNIPEFAEESDKAYDLFCVETAEEAVALISKLDKVKGLKGIRKVYAMDKRIQRALQVAGIRSRKWRKEEDGAEIIVMEVGYKWSPDASSALPDDPDGQGDAAGEARKRWQAVRDVTPHGGGRS